MTLSRAYGNTSAPGTIDTISTQVLDQLNLEQGEARTSQDRPHVLSASGSVEVPKTRGLVISAGMQYQSGTPFTLTDSSTDPDRNGSFQEPLAAGSYSPLAATGDPFPVENIGGMRGARGPSLFLLNLRAGYRIRLPGGRSLQAHVDVFNVTNKANFNTPNGDRRDTATFPVLRQVTAPTRTAQFNLKYSF
ncbi:MAG: hypothetical protein Q7R30_14065 [Acidobacteriota bacterium]|nr:hypothetical protein [Acidobacteriota bacterium]